MAGCKIKRSCRVCKRGSAVFFATDELWEAVRRVLHCEILPAIRRRYLSTLGDGPDRSLLIIKEEAGRIDWSEYAREIWQIGPFTVVRSDWHRVPVRAVMIWLTECLETLKQRDIKVYAQMAKSWGRVTSFFKVPSPCIFIRKTCTKGHVNHPRRSLKSGLGGINEI